MIVSCPYEIIVDWQEHIASGVLAAAEQGVRVDCVLFWDSDEGAVRPVPHWCSGKSMLKSQIFVILKFTELIPLIFHGRKRP